VPLPFFVLSIYLVAVLLSVKRGGWYNSDEDNFVLCEDTKSVCNRRAFAKEHSKKQLFYADAVMVANENALPTMLQ
jgi:hypothetical protein